MYKKRGNIDASTMILMYPYLGYQTQRSVRLHSLTQEKGAINSKASSEQSFALVRVDLSHKWVSITRQACGTSVQPS